MKVLTGNDLKTGDVIWWTGSDWSRHVKDAADVGDHGEAVLATEEGAGRVNTAYITDAERTPRGPWPTNIKQRIRALGPTVRPDLLLQPVDPGAGGWII